MPPLQDEVFSQTEGDRWFDRNRGALARFSADRDLPLRLLELYQVRPRSVLEVGAANGVRLAAIAEKTGARCVAVEPSSTAIADGVARYPGVAFVQGRASSIPLNDSFDLVIVNFVLHWVDRTTLFQSLSELDRVVSNGGYLLIGDFFPAYPTKVPYHHLPSGEMFTYKQNYASPFIESGMYTPIALLTSSHESSTLSGGTADNDRAGFWMLKKSPNDHYCPGSFTGGK
jgi:ubiquinone/menaquinone biosynthesis C-methylase UbiE